MNYRVSNYIKSLDALFEVADKITDEEVKGHFSKYLCIKTSGLLETYFKGQIGDYVDATSPKPIANFTKDKFKTFTNIDTNKIQKLFNSFSPIWTETFDKEMSDELKSSLNAIISNRNNIAHGNNDSITFLSIKEHYANVKQIILILDKIIKK